MTTSMCLLPAIRRYLLVLGLLMFGMNQALASGTVCGWGLMIISCQANGNFVRVAAGGFHSLALKSDGTVVGWGQAGAATPPANLSDVIEIAAGGLHSMALKRDGTVVSWGQSSGTPAGLGNVVAIAAGHDHSLALKSDGTVVGWGPSHAAPTPPPDLTNVVAISAGPYHSLALKSDGTVVSWGHSSPVPSGIGGAVAISVAEGSALILRVDGTVLGFGAAQGLSGLTDAVAVSAGKTVNLVLKRDGTLTAANNGWNSADLPVDLAGVVAISSGRWHGLALKRDGTVVGIKTKNPNPEGVDFAQAVAPSQLSDIVAIAQGYTSSFMLRRDGTVIGHGVDTSDYTIKSMPPDLTGVTAIAAGRWLVLALRGDGTVVGWGVYGIGPFARPPAGLADVIAISAGFQHGLALKRDGTVVAWGPPWSAGSAVPPGLSRVKAIAAGRDHNLALLEDGTVVGWGDNGSGQSTPPAGLEGVKAIAAGEGLSMALRNDGTVVSWGGSGVPPDPRGAIAIATAYGHVMAARGDGTVWDSSLTPPVGLTGVTAVGAGNNQSLALRSANRPPVARCAPATVVADSRCVANASIDNASFDPDSDGLTLTQSPTGPYPLLSTLVRLTVRDSKGATDSCEATVNVIDKSAPVIRVGQPLVVNATQPSGATVTNALLGTTALDNCTAVALQRIPATDSFPVGTTTITWGASDNYLNTSTATQAVTVLGASAQLENQINSVAALSLPSGISNSLISKLRLDGVGGPSACGQLRAFINEVDAQAGKAIPTPQAQALVADTERIRAVLACR